MCRNEHLSGRVKTRSVWDSGEGGDERENSSALGLDLSWGLGEEGLVV